MISKPEVVSADKWQQDRDELLKAEKDATRALDALAARRRRLPMVRFDNDRYQFGTPAGPTTLLDLFAGQQQLVVYQFMDNGPDEYCPGCTHFTNNVADLATLAENGVSWATVSNMPVAQIEAYKARMGWTMPFVSSRGTAFADDCGAAGGFMLSVFLRDGAGRLPDLLHHRPRRGPAPVRQQCSRPGPVRTPGGLGRLPAWLAAASHVRIAEAGWPGALSS